RYTVIHAGNGASVTPGATFSAVVMDGHPDCTPGPYATYTASDVDVHLGGTLWFADADADGYGSPDPATSIRSCSPTPPRGSVRNDQDCDDSNPNVPPFAAELCNGMDDDCDGVTDNNPVDGHTWHADADGDGYGSSDPAATIRSCSPTPPPGYVADASD